jgi:hypothetical protein
LTRDPSKEQDIILNGNRFVRNTGEITGVFLRDPDKLLHQYHNLRLSVYNMYKEYIPDGTTRKELKSYIDEQFIRLVKEYEINGEVDFAGYIKKKLHYRVKHSYIKGEKRDRQRVFVPKGDYDVTSLIERSPSQDEELDYYEALQYALQDVHLTELEKEALFYTLQELTEPEIERAIREKHPEEKLSSATIRDALREVQWFLRTRLHKALDS